MFLKAVDNMMHQAQTKFHSRRAYDSNYSLHRAGIRQLREFRERERERRKKG
jgi:hypothetical protein